MAGMPPVSPDFPGSRRRAWLLALLVPALASGCVNIFAMTAKIIKGDPEIPSAFQRQTGASLKKGKVRIAVVCDAPNAALEQFDTLAVDLQEEMLQRMKLHGLVTADVDAVASVLESAGAGFSPAAIADKLDVDFIVYIQIEGYSDREAGATNLYRGRAQGVVRAYQVVHEPEKRFFEAFQQDFRCEYPTLHPMPADQTPRRVFQQQFLDHLAEQLGRRFYNVRVTEALNTDL